MRIETEGGTTFTVQDGQITITRHNQPECTIPEDDLDEFWAQFADMLTTGEPEDA